MATVVSVGGRTVYLPDNCGSISIFNNVLFVNGEVWNDESGRPPDLGKVLSIEVKGDLVSLTTDRCVDVTGSVGGNVSAGGYVKAGGAVGGAVRADGYVDCGDVAGDVSADGYVKCGKVGGSVKAGGYVRHG
jgi:hypothetical protein